MVKMKNIFKRNKIKNEGILVSIIYDTYHDKYKPASNFYYDKFIIKINKNKKYGIEKDLELKLEREELKFIDFIYDVFCEKENEYLCKYYEKPALIKVYISEEELKQLLIITDKSEEELRIMFIEIQLKLIEMRKELWTEKFWRL